MNKRLLFSLKYALFCTFTAFLMITVFAGHYRFDADFFISVFSAFGGAFLAGYLLFIKRRKFHHTRVGVAALIGSLIFSWLGFFINRMLLIGQKPFNSFLHALIDAWTNFLAGALIMVPAFVLLVYLAQERKVADPENSPSESPESGSVGE